MDLPYDWDLSQDFPISVDLLIENRFMCCGWVTTSARGGIPFLNETWRDLWKALSD